MRRLPRVLPLIAVLVAVLVAVAGCGLPSLPGLPGSGSGSSGGGSNTEALWPDVPQLPGSTQVPIDLPLPVKLLVKGFVSAAQSSSDTGGQASKDYDFKIYQAAGSGTDLGSFYSQAQMAATGWTQSEAACGASSPIPSAGGALCLFTKPASDGFTDNLAIVLLPGEGDGGSDQIAYVRFSNRG